MTEIPKNIVEEAQVIAIAVEAGDAAPCESLGLAKAVIALEGGESPELAVEIKEAYRLAESMGRKGQSEATEVRRAAQLLANGDVEEARTRFDDIANRLAQRAHTQTDAVRALGTR